MESVPQDVDLAGRGDEVLAHHGHHGAGNDAEELLDRVQHCTAVRSARWPLIQCVDDRAELGHLEQRGFGRVADGDVLLDGGELGLRRVVVVLHAGDAAEDFAEVEGFDGDAAALQQFLASSGRC